MIDENAESGAERPAPGAVLPEAEIADRRRIERELTDTLLNLEAAEEQASLGSWNFDVQTGRGWWSKQMYKLFGYDPAKGFPSNEEYFELIHPEDRELLARTMAQMAQGVLPEKRDFRTNPERGRMRVLAPQYRVGTNAAGEVVRFSGTVLDITERKQAEDERRSSEAKYHSLFQTLTQGIVYQAADGQIIDANPTAMKILGLTLDQLQGRTSTDTRWKAIREDGSEFIGEAHPAMIALRTGQPVGHVIMGVYNPIMDSYRWINICATPLIGPGETTPSQVYTMFEDITERKRAEDALRASEEKYRGLLESLDSVVATVDQDGRFLYVNDVGARQLERAPEEVVGRTMHELFPKPVADRQLGNVRRAILADRMIVNEAPSAVRGQPRWYRTAIQPIHDERDRAVYALINATDIHDIKAAQQELEILNRTLEERVRQRTAEMQDLYDNAPCGYHSLDARGIIVRINQTELSWLGRAREEVVGRPLAEFITPASAEAFDTHFLEFMRRGHVRDLEIELVRADGTIFPALVSATAIYGSDGSYMMSRTSVFDNAERKRAQDALRESEAQSRLLFEEAPDAVLLLDADGRVTRINHALEALTGYGRERIVGRVLEELNLLSDAHLEQLTTAILQSLQSSDVAAAEFEITRADGGIRSLGARVFALKLNGALHYLTTLRDITAAKRTEEALRLANAEMERAMHLKDEFLANMSHELRTPLNAILAFSEGLLEQIRGPLNEYQQAALRHIDASGRHLLELITDILDLSKVEAGRLELQIEPVPVAEVCRAGLVLVREMAARKSLPLAFRLDDQLATIEADPKRLKQMLVNLLSNAVKFTPAGGQVSLEVTVDAAAGVARFAVRDTGIGIAAADMARLFQPFTQLDSSLSRQQEGTGLGLALVRRLAELHGGSITLESVVGKGSCFTIALPYRETEPARARSPAAPVSLSSGEPAGAATSGGGARGPRILLADDNEANVIAIADYLGGKGYCVSIARNGREALDLAVETRPDAILMDIQMPELDGIEATRRLRARPECAATPIIALTALAMPGDRERCLAVGANEYLTKPVSLKGLAATIQRLLGAD